MGHDLTSAIAIHCLWSSLQSSLVVASTILWGSGFHFCAATTAEVDPNLMVTFRTFYTRFDTISIEVVGHYQPPPIVTRASGRITTTPRWVAQPSTVLQLRETNQPARPAHVHITLRFRKTPGSVWRSPQYMPTTQVRYWTCLENSGCHTFSFQFSRTKRFLLMPHYQLKHLYAIVSYFTCLAVLKIAKICINHTHAMTLVSSTKCSWRFVTACFASKATSTHQCRKFNYAFNYNYRTQLLTLSKITISGAKKSHDRRNAQ